MDVYCALTDNGTDIQVHDDTGSDAQRYEIIGRPDGTYYIKPKIGRGSKSLYINRRSNNSRDWYKIVGFKCI